MRRSLAAIGLLTVLALAVPSVSSVPNLGFFAYPPEKVYFSLYSVMADGAEGIPLRHSASLVNWTSKLCRAELIRP